ncbi:hypothetical protein ANANG_G00024560 [Anguilla anguilla]|uniref:Mitochondrial 2-oxodicarboxylate carrier n=1 Tax=Anguilla anguilla TaxID=7936 RepID=A0A9D3S6Y1_ANGAN|nr:hypothetical protein ANANG_G00024560 [Anguilla anguilla]
MAIGYLQLTSVSALKHLLLKVVSDNPQAVRPFPVVHSQQLQRKLQRNAQNVCFKTAKLTTGSISSDHCWWIGGSGGDLSHAPSGRGEDQVPDPEGHQRPERLQGPGRLLQDHFPERRGVRVLQGHPPPILAETPKRAVKFFTFEQYKKLLSFTPLSAGLSLSVAGLAAGLTEAIVVNPFEVVKVSLQANRDSFKVQPSTFAQARHIIQSDGLGLRGLNKGLTSTLGRHGVFNMIYFGFYFNVKDAIPASQDPTLEFLRKFAIGLTSGTISSCVNIPFDTMGMVYREEGYLALYKGLVPKIMRLGPGGAVMLLVYEYVSGWLQKNW